MFELIQSLPGSLHGLVVHHFTAQWIPHWSREKGKLEEAGVQKA